MFGKGQDDNSLLSQVDRAINNNQSTFNMSKGDQLRDYLPVEKVAEYIVKISIQDKITFEELIRLVFKKIFYNIWLSQPFLRRN